MNLKFAVAQVAAASFLLFQSASCDPLLKLFRRPPPSPRATCEFTHRPISGDNPGIAHTYEVTMRLPVNPPKRWGVDDRLCKGEHAERFRDIIRKACDGENIKVRLPDEGYPMLGKGFCVFSVEMDGNHVLDMFPQYDPTSPPNCAHNAIRCTLQMHNAAFPKMCVDVNPRVPFSPDSN